MIIVSYIVLAVGLIFLFASGLTNNKYLSGYYPSLIGYSLNTLGQIMIGSTVHNWLSIFNYLAAGVSLYFMVMFIRRFHPSKKA